MGIEKKIGSAIKDSFQGQEIIVDEAVNDEHKLALEREGLTSRTFRGLLLVSPLMSFDASGGGGERGLETTLNWEGVFKNSPSLRM